MKQRLLYVEENQDGTTGGSHYCLLELIKAIDRDRFEVYVIFYQSNRMIGQFEEYAIVQIFNKPPTINLVAKIRASDVRWVRKTALLVKPVQFILNIIRTNVIPITYFSYYILKNKIRLVHLNNTVFTFFDWLVAAKLCRRKIVVHQRTHLARISNWLKHCHKYYDFIFGISEFTKQYLVENSVNADSSRYMTLYDTIDIEGFKAGMSQDADAIRQELGIDPGRPLIGIVGNIQEWKGQMTVIDAVSRLKPKYPDIACLLVGDFSNEREAFNSQILEKIKSSNLEENVIITGFRNDIADIQRSLDIFIHASIHPEPYGLVVLEAMLMGTAVIASNEGGPAEMIIDSETGFLVRPGDPEILADRIDMLLSDQQLRERIAKAGQKRFNDHFSTFDVKSVESVYTKLLKE